MADKLSDGAWKDNGNGTFTRGSVTIHIGDYVQYEDVADLSDESHSYTSYRRIDNLNNTHNSANYNRDQTIKASDYSYGWRVLGVDKSSGQLLLISEDMISIINGENDSEFNRTKFRFTGRSRYEFGEQELDNMCSVFADGTFATSARSVDVIDINRITGYDPMHEGTKSVDITNETVKNPYMKDTMYEYGNKVQFYWDGTNYPYFVSKNGHADNSNKLLSEHSTFNWYDGTSWRNSTKPTSLIEQVTNIEDMIQVVDDSDTSKVAEVECTFYGYSPRSASTDDSPSYLTIDDRAYDMLFTNSSTGAFPQGAGSKTGFSYFLASKYSCMYGYDCAGFSLRAVRDGYVGDSGVYYSTGASYDSYHGVRAVVSLDSGVTLKPGENRTDGIPSFALER